MAEFPAAKKTFTPVVDGSTFLEEILFNTGYDEIEALQTYIGASGEAQSKNAALNNLFRDMLDPLPLITRIDNDTIEIEAKSIVMFDGNNYVIKRNSSTFQITLSANLDTGSEANSTFYNVWLTGDGVSTTYSAVFSLSASAPTGFTYFKLIGRIFNDGSGNISALQRGTIPGNKRIHAAIDMNGTGGIVITSSYNVAAITDDGVGDYTITWDNDFADALYFVTGMTTANRSVGIITKATGSLAIRTFIISTGLQGDSSDINLIATNNE